MKMLSAITIAALLLFSPCSPATAAITEPVITATVADTSTMTLLIEGFNLPKGAVVMGQPGGGAKKLNVISASSTAIEAQLLSAEPGTYIVAIALSGDQFWTGYVTVGAAGPQGAQGPQGSPGADGSPYTPAVYRGESRSTQAVPGIPTRAEALCNDINDIAIHCGFIIPFSLEVAEQHLTHSSAVEDKCVIDVFNDTMFSGYFAAVISCLVIP